MLLPSLLKSGDQVYQKVIKQLYQKMLLLNLLITPVPFFMFGKLKKILYIQDVPFPYRRVWNRLPVFRAIFPLGY